MDVIQVPKLEASNDAVYTHLAFIKLASNASWPVYEFAPLRRGPIDELCLYTLGVSARAKTSTNGRNVKSA
jgi:hypothetical protein